MTTQELMPVLNSLAKQAAATDPRFRGVVFSIRPNFSAATAWRDGMELGLVSLQALRNAADGRLGDPVLGNFVAVMDSARVFG